MKLYITFFSFIFGIFSALLILTIIYPTLTPREIIFQEKFIALAIGSAIGSIMVYVGVTLKERGNF